MTMPNPTQPGEPSAREIAEPARKIAEDHFPFDRRMRLSLKLAIAAALTAERARGEASMRAAMAEALRWAEDAEHPSGELIDWPKMRSAPLAGWLTTTHDGDCTKQCHTCLRCHAEQLYREADAFAAAIRAIPGAEE